MDTKEHEAAVKEYIGRMLQNRKGRRKLAKRDKQIKNWANIQEYYGPINRPIDLGIKQFKKMARLNVAKPYKFVLRYKMEMYKALEEALKGETNVKAS